MSDTDTDESWFDQKMKDPKWRRGYEEEQAKMDKEYTDTDDVLERLQAYKLKTPMQFLLLDAIYAEIRSLREALKDRDMEITVLRSENTELRERLEAHREINVTHGEANKGLLKRLEAAEQDKARMNYLDECADPEDFDYGDQGKWKLMHADGSATESDDLRECIDVAREQEDP